MCYYTYYFIYKSTYTINISRYSKLLNTIRIANTLGDNEEVYYIICYLF